MNRSNFYIACKFFLVGSIISLLFLPLRVIFYPAYLSFGGLGVLLSVMIAGRRYLPKWPLSPFYGVWLLISTPISIWTLWLFGDVYWMRWIKGTKGLFSGDLDLESQLVGLLAAFIGGAILVSLPSLFRIRRFSIFKVSFLVGLSGWILMMVLAEIDQILVISGNFTMMMVWVSALAGLVGWLATLEQGETGEVLAP